MSKTFATKNSVGPVRAGNDGLLPRGRKAAFQPWSGLELGPKELAAQRRIAPVAVLVGVLSRDRAFLDHVTTLRASFWSSATLDPQLRDQIAAAYVRRAGFTRDVVAHVLAETAYNAHREYVFGPIAPTRPHSVTSLATVAVFVDDHLTNEDPRHWPHAKRWHEAALILAAVGAGRCPHLVERHGRLECCGTVPSRLERDGRQRRYCSRHQLPPKKKRDEEDQTAAYARAADRADREAVTNLLRAAGEALGVQVAGNTAAA